MRVPRGHTALIIVDTSWSERQHIRVLLGPTDGGRDRVNDAPDHGIIAKIVEGDDPRGLWIELDTDRRRRDPTISRRELLIPWGAILSICWHPDEPDSETSYLERLMQQGDLDRQ